MPRSHMPWRQQPRRSDPCPEMSPQSKALEKAQPVPWVALVAILSPGSQLCSPDAVSRKSSGWSEMATGDHHVQLVIAQPAPPSL